MYKFEKDKNISKSLQLLARHRQIETLLKDILIDLTVCKLENYNPTEYIEMIKNEIDNIYNKFKRRNK